MVLVPPTPVTTPEGVEARSPATPLLVGSALLIVYVVWGSTYLGIRVMVDQAPPMLSAGTRYAAAGLLVGLLLGLKGGFRRLLVSRRELLGCAFLGLMLPLLGNGVVSIAEQDVPSGITALLIASVPLMITIFRTVARDRPSPWTLLGVLVGFAGVAYLVLEGRHSTTDHIPLGPTLLVLLASTCWGFGSWMQPRLRLPQDPFVMTTYEMLVGGVLMVVFGLVRGEHLDLASYSGKTWLAWGYLVVFGSMVAFTAYVWVLGNAPISLVATYAYVNPVVAVFLGALVLGEPVTGAILVGGAVIVVGVALVISAERRRPH